jgi:hypothetical protein
VGMWQETGKGVSQSQLVSRTFPGSFLDPVTCKEAKFVRSHISKSLLMAQAEIFLDLSRIEGWTERSLVGVTSA